MLSSFPAIASRERFVKQLGTGSFSSSTESESGGEDGERCGFGNGFVCVDEVGLPGCFLTDETSGRSTAE